jgi:2-polyprenyl-3-methyl-5-hydroxy-6-metoxy-1,4-benzoquinol methylase
VQVVSALSAAGRFDKKAAGWDEDPQRLALAAGITGALEHEIAGMNRLRLLDYGAGTGLCSLPLAGKCSSVLAVDVSSGMLARLEEKARTNGLSHVRTLRWDVCIKPLAGIECDVILCAMTLHHVRDVGLLLRRFRTMLADGGLLALADLDKEDGTFHKDNSGVEHFGFRRDWLLNQLGKAGFTLVTVQTVHRIEKNNRSYPVFFMAARMRPSA